eukprot:CAMPEP_0201593266 /NCGR_PEP_ID=MMETSP0190_2-20130828/190930_1 /ASSEMBLY_ACC=CAM_ASM_000263 /TAXON_ID=37353 /ORGANISM="Rosalina sp." /LENGTH=94 /DNA_ID=CAMNT_0048052397 /DNA_START=348 /DNA_END=632 /DNA_ORIENTATION=+
MVIVMLNKDGFVKVQKCDPENLNGDCDTDLGWFCSSPEEDIWGCLPFGFGNVTRVETEDPTPAPTASPKFDEASASQLAVFGGMVIMIKYILFM